MYLHIEQVGNRKEWSICGLENGVVRCTDVQARQLWSWSKTGRLWPFEIVDWAEIEDWDTIATYFDIKFAQTFDLKRLG